MYQIQLRSTIGATRTLVMGDPFKTLEEAKEAIGYLKGRLAAAPLSGAFKECTYHIVKITNQSMRIQ